jgi:hypothetical protein
VGPSSSPFVSSTVAIIIKAAAWTDGMLVVFVRDKVVASSVDGVDGVSDALFGRGKLPMRTNVDPAGITGGWHATRGSITPGLCIWASSHVAEHGIWSNLHHGRNGSAPFVRKGIETTLSWDLQGHESMIIRVRTLDLSLSRFMLLESQRSVERGLDSDCSRPLAEVTIKHWQVAHNWVTS